MTKQTQAAPLNAKQIKAASNMIAAQGGYHDSLITCVSVGILSAMLDPKHEAFTTMLGLYAKDRLKDPADIEAFKSVKGWDYNRVRNRLTTAMKRAAKDLAAIEAEAAMTGKDKAEVAKDKANKAAASKAGKAGTKRSFQDVQMDRLQAVYNSAKRDHASDTPASVDHVAAFGLLHALADLMGQKLKEPTTPK